MALPLKSMLEVTRPVNLGLHPPLYSDFMDMLRRLISCRIIIIIIAEHYRPFLPMIVRVYLHWVLRVHFYFSYITTSIVDYLEYLAMEIEDYIMIIITEGDVKLNKWHIAMEKLYRKPTETEQN